MSNIPLNRLVITQENAPETHKLFMNWNNDNREQFALFALETISAIWLQSINIKTIMENTLEQVNDVVPEAINKSDIQRELLERFYIDFIERIVIDSVHEQVIDTLKEKFIEKYENDINDLFKQKKFAIEKEKEELEKLSNEINELGETIIDEYRSVRELPSTSAEATQDIRQKLIDRINWDEEEISDFLKETEDDYEIEAEGQVDLNPRSRSGLLTNVWGKLFTLNIEEVESEDNQFINILIPVGWELGENIKNPEQSPYRVEDFIKMYFNSSEQSKFFIFLFKNETSLFYQYKPFYAGKNYIIIPWEDKLFDFAIHYAEIWYKTNRIEDTEEESTNYTTKGVLDLLKSQLKKWRGGTGYQAYYTKMTTDLEKIMKLIIQAQINLEKTKFNIDKGLGEISVLAKNSDPDEFTKDLGDLINEFN